MNPEKKTARQNFDLSLGPVLLIGALLSAGFFSLILVGPLDYELLRRYCLSHPVAIACVSLYFTGLVTLGVKWRRGLAESNWLPKVSRVLGRLITEGADVSPNDRSGWLSALWISQPAGYRTSWIGRRVSQALEMQNSRGRRHQLEADLTSLAEGDADRQYESYSLLRIINWAMPMLGFLGTVLGISQTLGQLDTQLLATQQQEAMNQLTAGLYVAFDTTAIALVLTVCLMFMQFGIGRLELGLLARVDGELSRVLIPFLAEDPYNSQATLLAPVREMTTELVTTIRKLAEDQASIWSRSIQESQNQWANWTQAASERIETDLAEKITQALEQHVTGLERLQDEGYRQVDLRWQQWQTTMSDQARQIQGQQKEMVKQSEELRRLVDSTADLRKLEEVIQDSTLRLQSLQRLEEATLCVGEAVAVLATSLERAGIIRGAPVKPRAKATIPMTAGTAEALVDSGRADAVEDLEEGKAA